MSKKRKLVVLVIVLNVLIGLGVITSIVFLLTRPVVAPTDNTVIPTATINQLKEYESYSPDVNYTFTLANFPKIDGSTSNVPLRNFIICKTLGFTCAWQEFSDEIGVTRERYVDIATTDANLNLIRQKSVNSTTHNAYVKLINGETDLIFVATLPSSDEQNLMTERNVQLTRKAIAMDAFVFMVNKNNPVSSLTRQQVIDIYTGKITNWNQVGGADHPINAYQREDNSGSQELMKSLVLKGVKPIEAPNMVILGMMGLINRVSTDENGIGYSVYYYEQNMVVNSNLKLLAIDGIKPSYATLDNVEYPYSAPVYMAVRKNADVNSSAYNLFTWVLTRAGQKVVKDSGYVPIVKE